MTTFIVPVSLLREAARKLQPVEKLAFLTGVPLLNESVIVLMQLLEVKCSESRCSVEPDPCDVFRLQHELHGMGMEIYGQGHSHPGASARATFPSAKDLGTAKAWSERGPFLGAIFSEGGRYVRFFGAKGAERNVIVYGNCKALGNDAYELTTEKEADVEVLSNATEEALPVAAGQADTPGELGSGKD